MTTPSFFWYDYETFGTDTRRDRPVQFAGIRTTMELEPMAQPVMFFCQPSRDNLPSPEACIVTGITPQQAERKGVHEAGFAALVHEQLAEPGTCAAGYNSLRFDDEVTRHLLYRNFYDPYAREWQHGNSRWDLLDLLRLCAALRPDGVNWPQHNDGTTIFKQEALVKANGIGQEHAHDALSDVQALVNLARLIRTHKRRLWEWYFALRRKQFVFDLINLKAMQPLLHVSGRYPARQYCLRIIAPLARHPMRPNEIIIYDLASDPGPLLTLNEDEISDCLFTKLSDLPEGVKPIALRTIHVNRSPALAPLSVLDETSVERLQLDLERSYAHRDLLLRGAADLIPKVQRVFARATPATSATDPELALYEGFLPQCDKALLQKVRTSPPVDLARSEQFPFQDPRHASLLLRYRARNWPQTLSLTERVQWDHFRRERLTRRTPLTTLTLDDYFTHLAALRNDPSQQLHLDLLDQLQAWGEQLDLETRHIA